jgi:hypothetical protein
MLDRIIKENPCTQYQLEVKSCNALLHVLLICIFNCLKEF